jgi:hypothetical protein
MKLYEIDDFKLEGHGYIRWGCQYGSGLNIWGRWGWGENSLREDTSGADTAELKPRRPIPRIRNKRSKVDWSVSLGPTAGIAMGETPLGDRRDTARNVLCHAELCNTLKPPV